MIEEINTFIELGLSVIPTFPADHPDRPKRPTCKWKQYQDHAPTLAEIQHLFPTEKDYAVAVVAGRVSGNFEILDFDAPELFQPFMDQLRAARPELASLLLTQQTPSGGYHLLYRSCEPVQGNLKLARSADGRETKIETRGEGGYALVAPSPGYRLESDISTLATITAADRAFLHGLARSFDRHTEQAREPKLEACSHTDGERPGDVLERVADWHDLLTTDGWKYLQKVGDRHHYSRPGKTPPGTSATVNERGLYVFSSSTPLPAEQPIKKFGYVTHFRFNGDFKAAARWVVETYPEHFPKSRTSMIEEPPFPSDDDYQTNSGHSGHSGHSGQNGQNGQSESQFGQNPGQSERKWGGIAGDVREYVDGHPGEVKYSQLCQDIGIFTRRDKKTANDALNYLVKTGVIEKHPAKRGVYLPTEPGLEFMQPVIEKGIPLPLPFPLGLHNHFNVMPGTVIVIGGATNSGKTLMAMDLLRRWTGQLSGIGADPLVSPPHSLRSFSGGVPAPGEVDQRLVEIARTGIRYLNSEMTSEELGALLAEMGPDGDMLCHHVQWVSRQYDFPRAVLTDGITILDFLQIHRDFYEIGETIAQMADRVGAGLLVILIQKKSGESFPRGGEFALERARIALLLDSVTQNVKSCYLRKIKYPRDARNHPERKEIEYRIGDGLTIKPVSDLRWLDGKQRDRVHKDYQYKTFSEN
ncbi:bifunctional DNA primase/polymerase [Desulfoprunum benzoelyticum]|uniref:DNA primase/polymerase bifunctional N-terminal domain-containing protein n=1 Tax=Desulfoprunum benzoelyticum TaxID=1506996 RepID=A0A840URA3_9BACT|nr:bifunctional DNA primase/polymerase [Desulfoprunum benzoelyticum]MBB5347183.1 hypothetical protein [Desulfoprunum benzoelyticum]MBM9530491.1 bifunctional DNA primase/polymerase [Desulfoprunum benzoelyticum]